MTRYLIAETVALKPHLETAGEVALRLRDEGHEPVFSWLGDDLPWSEWRLPAFARLLGCSLKTRERRFEQILANEGIRIQSAIAPDSRRLLIALQWARQFDGDLETLKNYNFEGIRLGMGAASSLISLYGDSLYNPQRNLLEVRQCLASAALVYERARAVIAALQPQAVVTFNGRFVTARPIVAAAEAAGLKILRHERGATFHRYELFMDAIHNYAYIRSRIRELWAQADKSERERIGHEFFRRRREGDGIGWYSYTADQERGSIPSKVPGKRRVVYFSSSDDEYTCATDAFDPGPWGSQIGAVQALLEASKRYSDIELVFRIHPHMVKKSAAEQARWLHFPDTTVIGPNEKIDTYALMDSADIVASYGSTAGMEAAYWGRPSLLLGPGNYVGSPAVIEPKTTTALAELLAPGCALPVPEQVHCLPYGYYYLSFGTPYRYYQPQSLSEGVFLGERLGWDPEMVYKLRRNRIVKSLFRILHKRK